MLNLTPKPLTNFSKGQPPYEPELWNDIFWVANNNCYSYAVNCRYIGDKLAASPGELGGFTRNDYTNDTLHAALCADGLILAESFKLLPPEGYFRIAAFNHPDDSCHFYRENSDGSWSHKPGKREVEIVFGFENRLQENNLSCTEEARWGEMIGIYFVPCPGIILPGSNHER